MEPSKLYTELAEIYDLFYQKHFNYPKIAKYLDSVLKKPKAKKILHVGSGPGRLSNILAGRYKYDVHLLDSSKEMIDLSHQLLPKAPHTLADMRDFHLDDEFDAIISAGRAFSDLMTDEDIDEALEKFQDSLKMGGIVIFDVFDTKKMIDDEIYLEKMQIKNGRSDVSRHVKTKLISYEPTLASVDFSFRVSRNGKTDFYNANHIIRGYDKDEIKKILKKADFEVLDFAPGLDETSFYVIAVAD